MKMKILITFFTYVVFAASYSYAMEDNPEKSKLSFTPSGFVATVAGQLVKFKFKGYERNHRWINQTLLNFQGNITFGDHLKIHLGMEGLMWFNTYPESDVMSDYEFQKAFYSFYPDRAEGIFSFGKPEKFSMGIGIGLFPYKYNPDAWNLGEYLFRSGVYPGYIKNTFDWPMSRISGIRINNTNFGLWHNDILLTREIEMWPLNDISLTYITNVKAPVENSVFDLGAGIQFCRLIPIDDSLTNPKDVYFFENVVTDEFGQVISQDTAYYSYQGTKLMARLTFDPKGIFALLGWDRFNAIFGKEDLKMFSEIAFLGLKDYGEYYDTLSQRIPVMFGINLPFFRLLDVASLQFEYYGCRFPNSYWDATNAFKGYPLPDNLQGVYQIEDYRKDNWKWSLFIKKTIANHFTITGQVARDHIRTVSFYANNLDVEECLSKNKHWYWIMKLGFVF